MFHTSRFFSAIFIFSLTASTGFSFAQKPNILWIYAEDTSPWMGCYGDAVNIDATPNIDAIAEAGVRFKLSPAAGGLAATAASIPEETGCKRRQAVRQCVYMYIVTSPHEEVLLGRYIYIYICK